MNIIYESVTNVTIIDNNTIIDKSGHVYYRVKFDKRRGCENCKECVFDWNKSWCSVDDSLREGRCHDNSVKGTPLFYWKLNDKICLQTEINY